MDTGAEMAQRTDSEAVKLSAKTETRNKKKKRAQLTINLTNCKYDCVRRVSRRFGLRPVGDEEEWTIYWIDTSVIMERVMDMKRYQKINHFPGMVEICRKDLLARNMTRMLKLFPKDYNCFPRTWCLPADHGDFQAYCRAKKNKTFISKPESGSQGKGIFVFKNPKEIRPGEHMVVQQYISKAFILDGFKFDLRIYVLVTSCDPLRVYVYKDGLARFATVKYHNPTNGNMSDVYMHLTNYAINKHSKDFVRDDDAGSKRRITTVNKWFEDNGYDVKKIWHDIEDVIIKTLLAAHPILKHNYRSCFPNHNRGSACFEILGFDVLLDHKLKPWLIEFLTSFTYYKHNLIPRPSTVQFVFTYGRPGNKVNHSPSFHTDAPLDKEVKEGLLMDAFNLIDLYANDKRKCMEEDRRKVKERLLWRQRSKEASQVEDDTQAKYEAHLEEYEKTHKGGFRRIYPNGEEAYYAKFFDQSTSLCTETAASRARSELSRQQREGIEAKQKEMDQYRKKVGNPSAASASKGGGGSNGGRIEGLTAESPLGERKRTASGATVRRRAMSFRLPSHSASQRKLRQNTDQQSIVPYGEGVSPQKIKDDEELQRLAGLQLRDSLVRGLGVSEQLQVALEPPDHKQANTTVPPPPEPPQFFTHTVYHDSGVELSYSHGSHPPSSHTTFIHRPTKSGSLSQSTHTTPLHTLPGSLSQSTHTTPLHTLPGSLSQSTHTTPLHTLPGSLSQSTHTTPLHRSTEPGSHSQPNLATSLHAGSTKLRPIPSHCGSKGHSAPHHPLSSTAFRCTYKRSLAGHQSQPTSMSQGCHIARPLRPPPSLIANPKLLGLSVISTPVRLNTRKHSFHRPPAGCDAWRYSEYQPCRMFDQKMEQSKLLPSQ